VLSLMAIARPLELLRFLITAKVLYTRKIVERYGNRFVVGAQLH
jgi:hypothetical protein